MKDFYDIWLLSHLFDFKGETLAEAVRQTFARRRTAIPAQLAALEEGFATADVPQRQWQTFLHRSRIDNAPTRFTEVVAQLRTFLLPVMIALIEEQPFQKYWHASGPWQATK